MKFGQLIEYNMRIQYFFLKNHKQNVTEKLLPDSSINKIK